MSLSNVCAAGLAAILVATAFPAILPQAELAAPGLQVFRDANIGGFNASVLLHGLIGKVGFPLVVVSLAMALIAQDRKPGAAKPAAAILLIVGLMSVAGAFVYVYALAPRSTADIVSSDMGAMLDGIELAGRVLAVAVVASVVFLAVAAAAVRLSTIIFAAAAGAALLYAELLRFVGASGGADMALLDTYHELAADHAQAMSVVIGAIGILAAWAVRLKRNPNAGMAAALSAGLLAAGGGMTLVTSWLGLQGMPRQYADYTPAFADGHRWITIWGAAFAGLVVLALVWIGLNAIRKPDSQATEDVFT